MSFTETFLPKKGRPKIGVPLTFRTAEEEKRELSALQENPPDFFEWRVDFLDPEGTLPLEAVQEARKLYDSFFPSVPLLITLRTAPQGGRFRGGEALYWKRLFLAAIPLRPSFLDVELAGSPAKRKKLIALCHEKGIGVWESFHDVRRTVTKDQAEAFMKQVISEGGDLLKIACLPRDEKEAASLLLMAAELEEAFPRNPLLLIGMGAAGRLTRLAGPRLGAPVTFAAGSRASAPGQIPLPLMKKIVAALYGTE